MLAEPEGSRSRITSKFRLPSRRSYIRSHGYPFRAEGGARDATEPAGVLGEQPRLLKKPLQPRHDPPLVREFRLLRFVAEPLVGPAVRAFGSLRNRIGVVAAPTELPLDPGRLLQPARLPSLALAPVAEPAALPAAKVESVGIELCDPATAAGRRAPSSLCGHPARVGRAAARPAGSGGRSCRVTD
jgi:hypothetical protein